MPHPYYDFYASGDARAGVAALGCILAEKPTDAQAFHWRGRIFEDHLFDAEAALTDYREATKLDPQNDVFLFVRGRLEIAMRLWGAALETWQRYRAIRPDEAGRAATFLVVANAEIGDWTSAWIFSEEAIAVHPLDPQTRFYRGQMQLRNGNRDAAIREFTIAQHTYQERGATEELATIAQLLGS